MFSPLKTLAVFKPGVHIVGVITFHTVVTAVVWENRLDPVEQQCHVFRRVTEIVSASRSVCFVLHGLH